MILNPWTPWQKQKQKQKQIQNTADRPCQIEQSALPPIPSLKRIDLIFISSFWNGEAGKVYKARATVASHDRGTKARVFMRSGRHLSAVSGGEKEQDHQYLLEPLGEPHLSTSRNFLSILIKRAPQWTRPIEPYYVRSGNL